jgi:hypothetical protein
MPFGRAAIETTLDRLGYGIVVLPAISGRDRD